MSNKLDAIIAEHVMGWRRFKSISYEGFVHFLSPSSIESEYFQWKITSGQLMPVDVGNEANAPCFSTDIARAFDVVAKMRERGYWLQLEIPASASEPVAAKFFQIPSLGARRSMADSTPEAICLAALVSLGVEVPADA